MSLRLPGDNALDLNDKALRNMVQSYLRNNGAPDVRVLWVTSTRQGGELVFRFGVTTDAKELAPVEPKA